MRNFTSLILKIVVAVFVVAGAYLLFVNKPASAPKDPAYSLEGLTPQAALLKKHLLQYGKPQRVEVRNLTERLAQSAEDVKKIILPLADQSEFYVAIDLFTDENDPTAPLVAQIQYFDIKTENKIKEEAINLE